MVEKFIEFIRSFRNLRLERNIKFDIKFKVYIKIDDFLMVN